MFFHQGFTAQFWCPTTDVFRGFYTDKENSCGETVESNICGEILTEKKIKIYSQAKV